MSKKGIGILILLNIDVGEFEGWVKNASENDKIAILDVISQCYMLRNRWFPRRNILE